MDPALTSIDLLAHFDGPVVERTGRKLPARGVGWVLRWAAALAVLFVAAGVLMEFGYCLAAEHTLVRAARAGVLEATLPRATFQSVAESVERRLTNYALPTGRLRLSVEQNGSPVRGTFHARDGDRLSVALAVPTDAVLPNWVRMATFWRGDSQIEVRAERRMPGRQLVMPARG